MQVGCLSKKWWVLLGAALVAAWVFHLPVTTADEGTPAGGDQPGTVEASQPADAPEAEPGAPVWEGSPPPAPEAEAGAPSQEVTVSGEAAGQQAETQEVSGRGASADSGALAVFELQGLFIGMPLGDAKDVLDNLLGVESAIQPDPQSGGLRVGVDGYAFVTGDDRQGAVRIEFLQKLIDALYQTEGLRSKDFVKKFSSLYSIQMDIDVARRHTAWEGLTPDGLKVTITSTDSDDKILVLEKR